MASSAVALIPAAPLLAAILITWLGPKVLGEKSHWLCWGAIGFSFAISLSLLLAGPKVEQTVVYSWIDFKTMQVPVIFQLDALTRIMLVVVTGVGLMVAVFSAGYMSHDPGYPRFFAEFSLFVFSMTGLVLASNFLLLYVFWESVGLCSYLLIGFWFARPAAAAAARKAFLVNRIGDFGFLLGILLLWVTFDFNMGFAETLGNPDAIAKIATDNPGRITLICLLLSCGAVGKSAQFPLHVWLPDAMEGPTPASALIHAATMVTAGVYMVARCTPLFVHSPDAQLVVAGIGGTTALLAALIALTQTDLKRVLAYSTLSQLGYMFLALGSAAGNPKLASFAVVAAIFHLFTHAFFKALLFLSAGSVMHAMGNVIDMRKFSGLRHALPITHWSFLAGAVALAGLPPFAGFWSKDEILMALFAGGEEGPYKSYFLFLFGVGVGTAALTAFYTFRAYFMTFWGEEKFPPEAGHHPHDASAVMAIPLAVLALFALGVGAAAGPTHWFPHYVAETAGLPHAEEVHVGHLPMILGSVAGVLGVALAWIMYGRPSILPERLATGFPRLYRLSLDRFYLDEILYSFFVKPTMTFARRLTRADNRGLDATVDLIGSTPAAFGRAFRFAQNGLVQSYALITFLGVAVILLVLLRSAAP